MQHQCCEFNLCGIEPMRRSVQSYAEISIFPLDKSGFPAAVNNTSLSFRIRDKKAARVRCAMEKSRLSSILIAAMLLAVAVIAEAQQPKKIPRIGYLVGGDPTTESTRSKGIQLALRELGYIEGQNIATEYRYAEGRSDRQPELAAELVRLKVDIIVAAGGGLSRRPRMRPIRSPSLWRALQTILSRRA